MRNPTVTGCGDNDRFDATDLNEVSWDQTRIFHFGYPPIMRKMFERHGKELAAIFKLARSKGVLTSLDMCMPDSKSDSGKVDWRRICKRVLPLVDLFCPSFEELLYMLDRPMYDKLNKRGISLSRDASGRLLSALAERCLAMGAGAVLIKIGDQGLYLRTAAETRLGEIASDWRGRELHCNCRRVNVVGTTGSGDCTIAGFLLAVLRGKNPDVALQWSTAVGATCCESSDSISAITKWAAIQKRIDRGWAWLPAKIKLDGWKKAGHLRAGPNDTCF